MAQISQFFWRSLDLRSIFVNLISFNKILKSIKDLFMRKMLVFIYIYIYIHTHILWVVLYLYLHGLKFCSKSLITLFLNYSKTFETIIGIDGFNIWDQIFVLFVNILYHMWKMIYILLDGPSMIKEPKENLVEIYKMSYHLYFESCIIQRLLPNFNWVYFFPINLLGKQISQCNDNYIRVCKRVSFVQIQKLLEIKYTSIDKIKYTSIDKMKY